jgi:hypothetical protein
MCADSLYIQSIQRTSGENKMTKNKFKQKFSEDIKAAFDDVCDDQYPDLLDELTVKYSDQLEIEDETKVEKWIRACI